jgi:hypothetical protein
MRFAIEQLQSLQRWLSRLERRLANLEAVEADANHTHSAYVTLTGDQTVAGAKSWTGAQTVTSPAAATVPLTVNGAASQTADLQRWRNSGGTVVAQVSSTGGLRSGEQSVNDDTALTLYTDSYAGMLLVWIGGQAQGYAMMFIRAGQSSPFAVIMAGGTVFEATTSDLTGTTGTDGKVTVGATATALKVENRFGATVIVRWLQIR